MADNEYVYANARIHTREMTLLNASFLEQLLNAPDEDAALRLLREKGWSEGNADEMLTGETQKTWDIIGELVKDLSVFDVFLYPFDYHNLKAALKEVCIAGQHPGIYLTRGTVPAETILQAVDQNDFSLLPEHMRTAAEEAKTVLLQTRDGQLCDCLVDRAALNAISAAGRKTGTPLLQQYGEITVATADIKIAVRAAHTKKDGDFLRRSLAPCDSLNTDELIQAACIGEEAVCAYLLKTDYADAVSALKSSNAAFERWCDNLLMARIRPQLHNPFGLEPLAAYILARDNEIKTVRIILSGVRNGLPKGEIRERVRETYV